MNKYQEAIRKLKEYAIFQPNSPCERDLNTMQELVDKQEKYRWHDLRKDSNDLPKNDSRVFACLLMDYGKRYYECPYYNDKFKIEYSNRIIGWKYIEEFEDE